MSTIETSKIDIVSAPQGIEGPGFFATRIDKVVGMARANSLWPLPFATSCFRPIITLHFNLRFDKSSIEYQTVQGCDARKAS